MKAANEQNKKQTTLLHLVWMAMEDGRNPSHVLVDERYCSCLTRLMFLCKVKSKLTFSSLPHLPLSLSPTVTRVIRRIADDDKKEMPNKEEAAPPPPPQPKMKFGEAYNPEVVSLYGQKYNKLTLNDQNPKKKYGEEYKPGVVSLTGQGKPKAPPKVKYSEGFQPSVVHW